jgi:xanthine dehydrogenase accessory factor
LKHWQELAHILDRVLGYAPASRSAALAVVVSISRSAYRRPGAKLLIDGDGGFIGGVSGGCLEEDVREIGLEVMRTASSRVLHYDTGSDETTLWGLGLGCDGEVDILVQPISDGPDGLWRCVRALLEADRPFALSKLVEEGGLGSTAVVDSLGKLAGWASDRADPGLERVLVEAARAALDSRNTSVQVIGGRRIFTEVLMPPPKLIVCGAGDDARPTVAMAAAAGFRVLVADHRPAYLTAARFPEAHGLHLLRPEDTAAALPSGGDTYVVVKSHSLLRDTAWVKRFIATDVPYIGVLGPKARSTRILTGLGIAPGSRGERVFGPVGLDLGADGPEQVGVSIVAELLAVLSCRTPRHLREREEAIHST